MRLSTGAIIVIALLLLLPRLASTGGLTLPDHQLTPGAVATTSKAVVCTPGYASSVRPRGEQWRELKDRVYAEYGMPVGSRYGHVIDHEIPIEIGGSPTDIRNLWPQPYDESKQKDVVEDELHALVCDGRMPITQAQARVARDWTTAVGAGTTFSPSEQTWIGRNRDE